MVTPGQDKGKSYAEYTADKDGGGSWKSKLKIAINNLIPESKDFEDLLKRLQEQGYEIKRGKHISVRAPGQERFTRTKTLDADFTEEAITNRIATAAQSPERDETVIDFTPQTKTDLSDTAKPTYTRPTPAANLIIDIENCVKSQQSAGFARWQKIQNLKEAAKTLNFLTENNLLQYADMEAKNTEVAAAFDNAADSLKTAENRLTEMSALIKNISNYQQTKPIYDGMKTVTNKDAYRREHKSTIALHTAARKALKAHAGEGDKLPNPAALQEDYSRLIEKKNILRAEYSALKQQAHEYGIIKKNVDSILNPSTERARIKGRDAEL